MPFNPEALRRIREAWGWTQASLATKAGLSVTTISHLETGKTFLQLITLDYLARALEVQPEALMRRDAWKFWVDVVKIVRQLQRLQIQAYREGRRKGGVQIVLDPALGYVTLRSIRRSQTYYGGLPTGELLRILEEIPCYLSRQSILRRLRTALSYESA